VSPDIFVRYGKPKNVPASQHQQANIAAFCFAAILHAAIAPAGIDAQ
jgi:hypothetical protein